MPTQAMSRQSPAVPVTADGSLCTRETIAKKISCLPSGILASYFQQILRIRSCQAELGHSQSVAEFARQKIGRSSPAMALAIAISTPCKNPLAAETLRPAAIHF
jgi:hypothetical protein